MTRTKVGSGILSIITESLYDNPIVVFREYVQNSADSLYKSQRVKDSDVKIIKCKDFLNPESQNTKGGRSLIFLDNGNGIVKEDFYVQMKGIANSSKIKQKNIGYKGIGRLSGLPYCRRLYFFNIIDYENESYQMYSLDGDKYNELKTDENAQSMSIEELLDKLADSAESDKGDRLDTFRSNEDVTNYFGKHKKGFAVVMENIRPVLENIIEENSFIDDLGWLLPVDFKKELYENDDNIAKILNGFKKENGTDGPILSCNIAYQDTPIYRPIDRSNLRNIVGRLNFGYAVGFQTFSSGQIAIDRRNSFCGIRIYVDNMLLCNENEIMQNLDNYGLLDHTVNGQIQSVRGIGAIIYITDKVNISTNARRTFIEVTDTDSIDFLNQLANYVNSIYRARYALSYLMAAKRKKDVGISVDLESYKIGALNALKVLLQGEEKVDESNVPEYDFEKLDSNEKKKIIKKAILVGINKDIKDYLKICELDNSKPYQKFITWLCEKEN